jgi:TolA-binding protein
MSHHPNDPSRPDRRPPDDENPDPRQPPQVPPDTSDEDVIDLGPLAGEEEGRSAYRRPDWDADGGAPPTGRSEDDRPPSSTQLAGRSAAPPSGDALSPEEVLADTSEAEVDLGRMLPTGGDSADALASTSSATNLSPLGWSDTDLPAPPPSGEDDAPPAAAQPPSPFGQDLAEIAERLGKPVRRIDSSDIFAAGRFDDQDDQPVDPGAVIDMHRPGPDSDRSVVNLADAEGLPSEPLDERTVHEAALSAIVPRPADASVFDPEEDDSAIPTGGQRVTVANLSDELSLPEAPPTAGEVPAAPAPPPRARRERGSSLVSGGARRRSSAWGWVGGTVLGAVLAAGAGVGAWYAGWVPASLSSSARPRDTHAQQRTREDVIAEKTQIAKDKLAAGDPDAALVVLSEAPQTPEVAAFHGWVTWLKYLRACARDPNPRNRRPRDNNAAVRTARQELGEAQSADAAFWLGLMEEELGHVSRAREIYTEAMTKFPKDQQRFQAALDRVAVQSQPESTPRVGRAEPAGDGLLLASTLLLAPGDEPDAKAAEGGFEFWEAVKLAQDHNYREALVHLQRARDRHDLRRRELPGRGLNPGSDPREEIFLRCCDELKAYWDLRDKLKEAGEDVPPRGTVAPIVAKLIEERKGGADPKALQAARDEAKRALETAKAAGDKLVKAEADLKAAQDAKKALEERAAGLDQGRIKAEAEAKAMASQKQEAAEKLQKAEEAFRMAKAERDQAVAALDKTAAELKSASRLDAQAAPAAVPDAVAKLVAEVKTPPDDRVKLLNDRLAGKQAEVDRLTRQLSSVRSPAQVLDLWLAVLPDPSARADAAAALRDAEAVESDPAADATAKAKALAVKALASPAGDPMRAALAAALAHPGFKADQPWAAAVRDLAERLKSPEHDLKEATALRAAGRGDAALAVLDAALKNFPAGAHKEEHGQLLAERAVARLERNDLPGAAADAAAAREAGATDGPEFVLGQVAERQGNAAEAKAHYQRVIEAAPASKWAGRSRIALGRLLLGPRAGGAAPATGPVGARPPAATGERRADAAAAALAALLLLQPPAAPAPTPAEIDQMIRLADDAIANGDNEGHFLKARALALKGRHDEALAEYTRGLRRVVPPQYADDLREILREHPGLQTPAAPAADKAPTDPAAAERYYSSGVSAFFAGRLFDAESDLTEAVRQNGRDARHLYFLGLTRLRQGRSAAAAQDFRRAGDLERQYLPGPRAVNQSLERIQGTERAALDPYRP